MTATDKQDPEKNIEAHSQALSALGNFLPSSKFPPLLI